MNDKKSSTPLSNIISELPQTDLVLNEDFYINENGLYVFTEKYLLKRGFCCKNNCLHCPFDYKKRNDQ